jgi:hypothetical protein
MTTVCASALSDEFLLTDAASLGFPTRSNFEQRMFPLVKKFESNNPLIGRFKHRTVAHMFQCHELRLPYPSSSSYALLLFLKISFCTRSIFSFFPPFPVRPVALSPWSLFLKHIRSLWLVYLIPLK